MRRTLTALAALAALAAATSAGCAGRGEGSLTVWLMAGSAPADWIERLSAEFERRHGVPVTVEIQQWEGVQSRLTTALSENGTVDVLEIGNTQTTGFAAAGGLAPLGREAGWFARQPWHATLRASARLDGTLYAAPWYAASRVVVYDRGLWAGAGAEVPATRREWLVALAAIEQRTDAEPLYLPGQSYYLLGGFLADEGGAFATGTGGDAWRGGLNTPEGRAAMDFYARLRSFSRAPGDSTEATPQQSTEVVPQRRIACWIGLGWEVAAARAAIEERGGTADFGFFPVPGKTAGTPGHAFLGGSNLAVAARTDDETAARAWLRMATSRTWARRLVAATGETVVPGRTDAVAEPEPGSFAHAMSRAVTNGYLPPLTTGWANVETEPNPVREMMTRVLNGDAYPEAAAEADAEITTRINRE